MLSSSMQQNEDTRHIPEPDATYIARRKMTATKTAVRMVRFASRMASQVTNGLPYLDSDLTPPPRDRPFVGESCTEYG